MAGRRTILMVEDEQSITEPLAEALDSDSGSGSGSDDSSGDDSSGHGSDDD